MHGVCYASSEWDELTMLLTGKTDIIATGVCVIAECCLPQNLKKSKNTNRVKMTLAKFYPRVTSSTDNAALT